jgi:hypothetical protein
LFLEPIIYTATCANRKYENPIKKSIFCIWQP